MTDPVKFLEDLRAFLKEHGVTEFHSCACCQGLNVIIDGVQYQYLDLASDPMADADGLELSMRQYEPDIEFSIPWNP